MYCHYCDAPMQAWALSALTHTSICSGCSTDEKRVVEGASAAFDHMAAQMAAHREIPPAPGLSPDHWHALALAWLARVADRSARLAPWDPAQVPLVLRTAAATTNPDRRKELLLQTVISPHPGIRAFGVLCLAPEATTDPALAADVAADLAPDATASPSPRRTPPR